MIDEKRIEMSPGHCVNCGQFYKPLRRGRCHKCADYWYSHGFERPGSDPLPRGRKGEESAGWKGDAASRKAKWQRAQRQFVADICEECGEPALDRHHRDGDPGNNELRNVAILCRLCHMKSDGRLQSFIANGKAHNKSQAALRTHCPKGHEYSSENTYRAKGGGRKCRQCQRERLRAWRHSGCHAAFWQAEEPLFSSCGGEEG